MSPGANSGIMVIGFDANFCYLMQRYGRISAHKLIFAHHDEDFLAQVHNNQPGVIFIEVDNQASFAWNLLRELKSNQDTCKIPIILCSWQAEEQNSDQYHADFYLRLPILYEHYKAALDLVGD